MPLLIRLIAQRIVLAVLGFLAFLGINPDIHIPTQNELALVEKNQNKAIEEVFTVSDSDEEMEVKKEVSEIIEKITETQTEVQGGIESIVNIPEIKTTQTGIVAKENFYDDVVVNIVCINKGANNIKMTTGSGVIVSPSGIVLTNSHVANTLLFDDKTKDSYKKCTIRKENIPTYGFNVELVYLDKDWLQENQDFFLQSNPKGTGENDYALIAITTNTNPALSVPREFVYAPLIIDDLEIDRGDLITVATYPGMSTGVFEVDSNGKIKTVKTKITDLITFYSNSIDLISTEPNDAAKRGSSGGGVFKGENLLGIVVTTDDDGSGSYINALTIPYINTDFISDNKISLEDYLSKDKNFLIESYTDDVVELKKLISNFL